MGYPECGAKYDGIQNTLVGITNDDELSKRVDSLCIQLQNKLYYASIETTTWSQQFVTAMTVSGEGTSDPT